ncbi:transmembrane and ubiquitin-like domain-containing protein 1 isoform X2 [Liolophura sinensis]
MSLIEGVGDEVTFVFAALLIVIVVVCAWLSTHTRDIPFFSLLIVELTRGRRTVQPVVNTDSETNGGNVVAETPSTEASEVSGGSEQQEEVNNHIQTVDEPVTATGETTRSDIPHSSSNDHQRQLDNSLVDHETIRQRRLAFLSKEKDSAVNGSSDKTTTDRQRSDVSDGAGSHADNSETSQISPQRSVDEEPSVEPSVLQEIELSDGNIRVKLKYLNDTQRLVQTNPLETIGQFKRTHFGPELAANKLVRLIFNGQCLQNDTSTLQSYNIRDNCTVHCLVTEAQHQSTPPPTDTRNDLDIGIFMFPLFAVFLATIWYFRFAYRQYFNAMTTFSLVGITFLFSVAVFSTWRTHHGREEHQHLE